MRWRVAWLVVVAGCATRTTPEPEAPSAQDYYAGPPEERIEALEDVRQAREQLEAQSPRGERFPVADMSSDFYAPVPELEPEATDRDIHVASFEENCGTATSWAGELPRADWEPVQLPRFASVWPAQFRSRTVPAEFATGQAAFAEVARELRAGRWREWQRAGCPQGKLPHFGMSVVTDEANRVRAYLTMGAGEYDLYVDRIVFDADGEWVFGFLERRGVRYQGQQAYGHGIAVEGEADLECDWEELEPGHPDAPRLASSYCAKFIATAARARIALDECCRTPAGTFPLALPE